MSRVPNTAVWRMPLVTEIAIEEPKAPFVWRHYFLRFHRSGVEIVTALASNRHTYLVTALRREQQHEDRSRLASGALAHNYKESSAAEGITVLARPRSPVVLQCAQYFSSCPHLADLTGALGLLHPLQCAGLIRRSLSSKLPM